METEANEPGTGNSLRFVWMWVTVYLCSLPAGLTTEPLLALYTTIYIRMFTPM